MKISVIILTFNSEAIIAETLSSVMDVSDDIHIVDSFSTDETLTIAARFGAKVVQHPFLNYSAQRNWAIDNLVLTGDWELHLDSDEWLSPELALEIKVLKDHLPESVEGFLIPRLVHFLGRPIRHGAMFPTWHLRLFQRGRGRCEDLLYDQHFYLSGKIANLRHPMIDDHRNSIAEWTSRHMRWADAELQQLLSDRHSEIAARFAGNPIERKRALRGVYYKFPPLLRPFLFFTYRYIFRLGFLDGREGLIFFVLQTFWFRFLVDAKLFEAERKNRAARFSTGSSADISK